MASIGIGELLIVLPLLAILIVPFWKIFSKAGFSGWLSLTQIVPIVNLAALYYLAFADWPSRRDTDGPQSGMRN